MIAFTVDAGNGPAGSETGFAAEAAREAGQLMQVASGFSMTTGPAPLNTHGLRFAQLNGHPGCPLGGQMAHLVEVTRTNASGAPATSPTRVGQRVSLCAAQDGGVPFCPM